MNRTASTPTASWLISPPSWLRPATVAGTVEERWLPAASADASTPTPTATRTVAPMDHQVDRSERNFVHSERTTRLRLTGPAAGVIIGARVLVGPQGSYQAHNLWLLIGVELGAVGLVLFVTGLVVAAAEAARIPRTLRGPPLAALVGLCVGVFFLSSMEFKFFWMVMIIIAMNRNVAEAEKLESPGPSAGSVVDGQSDVPVGVPLR